MAASSCEECGGSSFITDPDTGETVCTTCGTVHSIQNLSQLMRRSFTQEEFDERTTHSPTNTKAWDGGISSVIHYTDIQSRSVSPEDRRRYMRLRRWDKRTKLNNSRMRNLSVASDKITRMVQRLDLTTNVHEETMHLYRKALNRDLVKGRSIINVAAACIYLACRIHKVPRRLNDFEKADKEIDKNAFRTAIRLLIRELDIKPGIHRTAPYIQQCVSKMKLPIEAERVAKEMLDDMVEKRQTGGKNPAVLAATLVYIAARRLRLRATQKDVAKVLGITEVSLRNTLNDRKKEGIFVLP